MRNRLLLVAIVVSLVGLGFANGVFATSQPTPDAVSPYTTQGTTATPCPTFTAAGPANAGTTTTTHTQTPTEPPTGGPCDESD